MSIIQMTWRVMMVEVHQQVHQEVQPHRCLICQHLVPLDMTHTVQKKHGLIGLSTQQTSQLPKRWICMMWSWPCGCKQQERPRTKEGCLAVMLQMLPTTKIRFRCGYNQWKSPLHSISCHQTYRYKNHLQAISERKISGRLLCQKKGSVVRMVRVSSIMEDTLPWVIHWLQPYDICTVATRVNVQQRDQRPQATGQLTSM